MLLSHIPEDLLNFKKITFGKTVIMGRKTFESIGKPLPNRNNIVISSFLKKQPRIDVCKNINQALEKAQFYNKKIFVIGGATIYEQFLPLADKLYLSWLKKNYEGDTFFPKFNKAEWEIKFKQEFNDFECAIYHRKC